LRKSKNYKVAPRTGPKEKKPPQPKPAPTQSNTEESEPMILNDEELAKFDLPTSFGANKGTRNTQQYIDKSKR
jgi:hypothetical protein